MKNDIDAQFLCKDCDRYNQCRYYHNRKEDSYICKYFEFHYDVPEKEPSKESKKCIWIKYDYRTICPKECGGENPYWRIPENMENLKYCPYCGREIEVQ